MKNNQNKIKMIFIIVILLASLCFRILPYWKNAFKDGNAYSADPDSCYHLRRAEISANHFPELMIIDTFSGVNTDNNIIWAPLYDWGLALFWYILAGFGFSKILITKILFFLSPIIATLNTYLVYKLSLLIYNNTASALISSAIFCVLPRNIIYSSLGNLDHHAAEIFLMTIIFICLIKLLNETNFKSTLKLSAAIIISTLVWTGSIFFGFCCIFIIIISKHRTNSFIIKALGIAFLIASIIIIPFSFYYYAKGAPLIDFYAFSFFQPLVYLICAAAIFFYLNIIINDKFLWKKWENIICIIGIISLIFIGKNILLGIQYILRKQPKFMSFVSESESIFISRQQFTFSALILYCSFLIFLLPIFYYILIKQKKLFSYNGFIFLSSIIPLFFLLICLQKKFSYHFSLPYSILISINIILFYYALKKYLKQIYSLLLIILLLIIAFYPIRVIFYFANDNLYSQLFTLLPALDWLKNNTPPLNYTFNQKEELDYYILSEWSYGHYIQYYSGRAVVADNFGKDNHMNLVAKILLSYSEKDALEMLHKYKVKYILVRDYLTTLYFLPSYLGGKSKEFFSTVRDQTGKWYVSPVGGLTFGFNLCEKPEIFDNPYHPLFNKIKLVNKWRDTHRELYRDGLIGYIYLYEVK